VTPLTFKPLAHHPMFRCVVIMFHEQKITSNMCTQNLYFSIRRHVVRGLCTDVIDATMCALESIFYIVMYITLHVKSH
jgi:hypothetical protein